jgi:hypothetical protein
LRGRAWIPGLELGAGVGLIGAGPVFIGIPIAASICAASAARREDYRWASHSAGTAIAMTIATVLFGRAFGGAPRPAGYGGLFQRVSITTGFGWLSAVSLRALASASAGR